MSSENLGALIKNRPRLVIALSAVTLALAGGDLFEIMPFAEPFVSTPAFGYFHHVHDILTLGLVLLVAYYWSAALGGFLLGGFFLVHLPYMYLTFPEEGAEHLTLLVQLFIGMGCIGLAGKLRAAVSDAHEAAGRSKHLAGHDPLTGLMNRARFQAEAQHSMSTAKRSNSSFAVMYIDLDRFKDINDSLGHGVGDKLLMCVSDRLRQTVREGDVVARLGGDEFAVIAQDLEKIENAAFLAERLIESVSQPIVIEGHTMHVSPSIGIAPYPVMVETEDQTTSATLLIHADMAMYRAKSNGRATFEFFDEQMSAETSERIVLLNDLRSAIGADQLELYYQPFVDIRTGKLKGAEALLRWNHPERGMIFPDCFVAAAETSGQIVEVGAWVLRAACAQNRAWQEAGLQAIKISVNLSPVQLRRQPLVQLVAEVLNETRLEAKYLDLEVTENAVMVDIEHSADVLRQLQDLGIGVSIDDFGTGYSSLSCLQQFSVNTLKIDQTFVRNLRRGSDSAVIAEAVIKLGHSLGLTVIAEGIETENELKYLRILGCDQGQGYYYSKPVTAEQFANQLMEDAKKTTCPSGVSVEFY